MSGYVPLRFRPYACVRGQRAPLAATMRMFGAELPDGSPPAVVSFTETYLARGLLAGGIRKVAEVVRTFAPGASWRMWEEPVEAVDYLGTVMAYTPDLGLFESDCTDGGVAVMTLEAVETLIGPVRDQFGDSDSPARAALTAVRVAVASGFGAAWTMDAEAHANLDRYEAHLRHDHDVPLAALSGDLVALHRETAAASGYRNQACGELFGDRS